ncbi:hypothetical protein HMPREF1982_03541 [Clostridiales bacterium oral taxon 876 str. F0540]|nr:hypothetical protein HMPREF1982_03541 [Clostridiales bacterium oral taxon 876 str. F0540]
MRIIIIDVEDDIRINNRRPRVKIRRPLPKGIMLEPLVVEPIRVRPINAVSRIII